MPAASTMILALLLKADATTLTHRAWQMTGNYAFGGRADFAGTQVPTPFDITKGTWGAFELAARVNALDIDNDAFPTYADPNRSASRAEGR